MSAVEILAELPKLKPEERRQLFERLCELQERDLREGVGPTEEERKMLDDLLAEYQQDKDSGEPWQQVLRDLRSTVGQ